MQTLLPIALHSWGTWIQSPLIPFPVPTRPNFCVWYLGKVNIAANDLPSNLDAPHPRLNEYMPFAA